MLGKFPGNEPGMSIYAPIGKETSSAIQKVLKDSLKYRVDTGPYACPYNICYFGFFDVLGG